MSKAMYERVRANPKFQQLVTRRRHFAWTLAIIVLLLFYGFVMVVAFSPAALGQPIAADSKITWGIAVVLFMFIFFWLLAAGYVYRANAEFDALTQEVLREAWQEQK